jgi:uncharacterized protein (DUF3820 family)
MDLPLITFGKYKGQPVTSLLADVPYLEWCKKQHWFSKCTPVYNICVNQNLLKVEKLEENTLLRDKLLQAEEKYKKIEEANTLLKDKLLQAEEKYKKIEEELLLLKTEKLAKRMKDYFGKKQGSYK